MKEERTIKTNLSINLNNLAQNQAAILSPFIKLISPSPGKHPLLIEENAIRLQPEKVEIAKNYISNLWKEKYKT